MRFKRTLSGLSVLILLSTAAPRASADLTFNAAADFSTASNPNGPWSYGTTGPTLTGPFALFSTLELNIDGAAGWNGWVGTESQFGDHFPAVSKNTTNVTLTPPNTVLLPGEMILHPAPDSSFGGDGAYAVVRFTAPAAGVFSLDTVFEGRSPTNEGFPEGTTTDVHVLLNGVSLFDGAVNGFGPSSDQSFATSLNLHVGDRIDFAVGIGSDGSFLNDSTGLDAIITNAVPEPSTATMTSILAICSGLAVWRRRVYSN
jgi:hypothetical protein